MSVFEQLHFIPDLYIVGGSVRDYLLGTASADVDVASPLKPSEVTALAEEHGVKAVASGEKFGTVTLVGDGWSYEHTTFRSDHNPDGRFCEVNYVATIKEDLARRDFTINAMAMDRNGNIVDPFGGQIDLQNRILRAVGDPRQRFEEDLLRIVRGWRFAARLNLKIEPKTEEAMNALGKRLIEELRTQDNPNGLISVERLISEITKTFKSERPSYLLNQMWQLGLIQTMIPEMSSMQKYIQNPQYHPEGDVWTHTMEVVDRTPPVPKLRWAALFHDIGKVVTACPIEEGWYTFYGHPEAGVEMIPGIFQRLRLPNQLMKFVQLVTQWHMYPLLNPPTKRNIRKFQAAVGDALADMMHIVKADVGEHWTEDIAKFFVPVEEPLKPVLMGRHLIKAGYKPGPEFREMLQRAYKYQLATGCSDITQLLKVATDV